MSKRVVAVALFGSTVDVDRELGWLKVWLPLTLGESSVHWSIYAADEVPDSYPDVYISLGGASSSSSTSLCASLVKMWVQTPAVLKPADDCPVRIWLNPSPCTADKVD